MSTGMASIDEIELAVRTVRETSDSELLLFHCVSSYPTITEDSNLNNLVWLRKKFGVQVGLSDHTTNNIAALTAIGMGAVAIERHYTLDNEMTGFDHKMSLNPKDFIAMVKAIREIELIKGEGQKFISETEWITRNKYHVSMASAIKISAGDVLTESMVVYRNPGTGIPAKDAPKILGKKAIRNIQSDTLLSFEMFE